MAKDKNFKVLLGLGDWTEIVETDEPVSRENRVFPTFHEAHKWEMEYTEKMQAWRCPACGGLDPNCPDCGGTGWI